MSHSHSKNRLTKPQAEDAVNLLFQHSVDIRDDITIYRDDSAGRPMVIVTVCPHCAELFDRFARLDDNEKRRALQSANAEKPQAANGNPEERQKQSKGT